MAAIKLTNFVADSITISEGVAVVCDRLRRFGNGLGHDGDWAWLAMASCSRAGRRESLELFWRRAFQATMPSVTATAMVTTTGRGRMRR
ncbi:hypothetical protein AXF42_Ash001095 [Apostasia shenzhenica]|uniref:Uncharacterized protein n=1 Tax=Apostasia shenzhenica TaxID=1088818 RepID=A0A2I0ATZ9_9ASPA|nr:hypothetical protein AXF42_Ash001095 [Apostasia shenzhenica]